MNTTLNKIIVKNNLKLKLFSLDSKYMDKFTIEEFNNYKEIVSHFREDDIGVEIKLTDSKNKYIKIFYKEDYILLLDYLKYQLINNKTKAVEIINKYSNWFDNGLVEAVNFSIQKNYNKEYKRRMRNFKNILENDEGIQNKVKENIREIYPLVEQEIKEYQKQLKRSK